MIFASALAVTASGVAVPQLMAAIDDTRTAGAARYFATRVQQARMEALTRSVEVAVQFSSGASGYTYRIYADGNGDGVRTRDIQRGVDWPIGPLERLSDHFGGVDFAARPGMPAAVSGGTPPGTNPIRLGNSTLLSFSPNGTSSSGSVYITGRGGAQYAICVFGTTGKARLMKLAANGAVWVAL